MNSTEKIIIGSTIVVGAAAITMLLTSKKYCILANSINSELEDIRYNVSKSREDLVILNQETAEGNKILRKLVKESAEEIVDSKNK